jgi:hypothetical protein
MLGGRGIIATAAPPSRTLHSAAISNIFGREGVIILRRWLF